MENFEDKIRAYMEKEKEVLEKLPTEDINKVINVLEEARKKGAVVYVCGNGGSAATAAHYVTDFNKGISLNQKHKYNLISLNDNIPSMTAIANDIGYEHIFEIQLQGRMKPSDILLAISGSGNSKNVLRAAQFAKETGAKVVALTGYDGGGLYKMADYNLHVTVDDMQITEDIHMILDHLMVSVLMGK